MRSSLIVLISMTVLAAPAGAGLPSPATSDVDPCIITCPAGDSAFTAILRHASGSPWAEGDCTLDLCGCPGVRLAPVEPGAPYTVVGCTVKATPAVDGVVRFPLHAGGVCSGATIPFAAGIWIRNLGAVASFDQDGDLSVTPADLSIINGKIGTSDRTADFNCDGVVTAADYNIAAAHIGHHDESIVGVGDGPNAGFGARAAPNPSRGAMDFVLRAPAHGHAMLAVYDLTGRRLATVLDREIEPGAQHVAWSGRDDAGRVVSAGLYFYRFSLGAQRAQGLLVIAR